MALEGDLACFGLFNDWLTGKSVGENAIVLDWIDNSVEKFLGLSFIIGLACSLDAVKSAWSNVSEWATTVSSEGAGVKGDGVSDVTGSRMGAVASETSQRNVEASISLFGSLA